MPPRPAAALNPRRLVLILTALAVAGCGGGSPSQSQAQGATPSPSAAALASSRASSPAEPLPSDIPVPAMTAKSGGAAGSGLVTITGGGTIHATADDGTRYTLEIPPGALGEDTTVEIYPLSGSTELGDIIAGADFAPAGLVLAMPGTLTVDLPSRQPAGLVGLAFSGDPAQTTSRLLPGTGPDTSGTTLRFSVPHFSGSVAADTGAKGNDLYTTWAATKDGSTPAARQAAAETRAAAATLAEKNGKISKETADAIRDRANEEWLKAEADRIGQEGDPADLTPVKESVERMVAREHEAQLYGTSNAEQAEAVTRQVIRITEARIKAIVDKINSPEIQSLIDSGRIAKLDDLEELIVALQIMETQLQYYGSEDSQSRSILLDMGTRIAEALVKSCKDAPVPISLIKKFRQLAALSGSDEYGSQLDPDTIRKCSGATPEPTTSSNFGRFAADGTITYAETDDVNGDIVTYTVTLNLKIREGEEALIFAKGSTFSATYHIEPAPKVGEGGEPIPYKCPTSYAWQDSIGTLANSGGGWDPGSAASPNGQGFAIDTEDNLELALSVGVDPDAWPDGCNQPKVEFGCPDSVELQGEPVPGTEPRVWSFTCSASKDNWSVKVGGQMIQVQDQPTIAP